MADATASSTAALPSASQAASATLWESRLRVNAAKMACTPPAASTAEVQPSTLARLPRVMHTGTTTGDSLPWRSSCSISDDTAPDSTICGPRAAARDSARSKLAVLPTVEAQVPCAVSAATTRATPPEEPMAVLALGAFANLASSAQDSWTTSAESQHADQRDNTAGMTRGDSAAHTACRKASSGSYAAAYLLSAADRTVVQSASTSCSCRRVVRTARAASSPSPPPSARAERSRPSSADALTAAAHCTRPSATTAPSRSSNAATADSNAVRPSADGVASADASSSAAQAVRISRRAARVGSNRAAYSAPC